MPIIIPKIFVGQATLQAVDLDNDFSAVTAYSSAIPGSDIQAGTVDKAQLVQQYAEFNISLQTPGAQAISTTQPRAVFGLPNLSNDTAAYLVLNGAYLCTAAGTSGTLTFHVEQGYFSAGAWVNKMGGTTYVVGATSLTGGTPLQSGALTITTPALSMDAANPSFLGLFITGVLDNSALSNAKDFLCVSFSLKRYLRT
jgi:hypothetical protein